jgi:hypothetical protein
MNVSALAQPALLKLSPKFYLLTCVHLQRGNHFVDVFRCHVHCAASHNTTHTQRRQPRANTNEIVAVVVVIKPWQQVLKSVSSKCVIFVAKHSIATK